MAWTITIEFGTRADLVFAVGDADRTMPSWRPRYTSRRYSEAEPPVFIEQLETWELNDIYVRENGDQEQMVDNWVEWFRTNLNDVADPPIGCVLKLDGSPRFIMRGRGASFPTHEEFRVEEVIGGEMRRGGGATFMLASVRMSGVVRAAASKAIPTYRHSYSEGFETRELRVEVVTQGGTSAKTAAETLGKLTLPSSRWRYLTSKSPYVEVERNEGDTRATGVCRIREQGAALPSGTIEWDDETIEHTTAEGTRVEVRYTARGSGAESAVRSQQPGQLVESRVQYSSSRKTASAVYITERTKDAGEKDDDTTVLRTWSFSIEGGGRPITHTPVMRGPAWTTVGSEQVWRVLERHTVVARQVSAVADIQLSGLIFPEHFIQARSREFGPQRQHQDQAASTALARWERGADRVYEMPTRPDPQQFLDGVLKARKTSRADYEQPERKGRSRA